jgi:uncharacterized delta-60 repeat protein
MLESRLGHGLIAMLGCWAVALLVTAPSVAAPGGLDPSFGQMGEFALQADAACRPGCPERTGSYAQALALAPDGKLLIAGVNFSDSSQPQEEEPQNTLVRLTDGGTLDAEFGSGGIAQAPSFAVTHLYVQGDGSLTAVGWGAIGVGGESGVERYTASGTAVGDVQWLLPPVVPQGPPIGAGTPQIDSEGRFVALGGTISPLVRQGNEPKLMRFLPTGALDETFGSDGIASLPPPSKTESNPFGSDTFALGEDGSVFVTAGTYLEHHGNEERKAHLVLYHFLPNGKLDQSFGRGGLVALPGSAGYENPALAIAPDGDVVLAVGEHLVKPKRKRMLVLRYTKSGRPDALFGHDGIVTRTWVSHEVIPRNVFALNGVVPSAIAFDARGDAVVAGTDYTYTPETGSVGKQFLARVTHSGFDCSFGLSGMIFDGPRTSANAVVVQADGHIAIAGERDDELAVARYIGGGTPHTCLGEHRSRKRKLSRESRRDSAAARSQASPRR